MANSDGNQNWLALYREAVLEPDLQTARKSRHASPKLKLQSASAPGNYGTPER